MASAKSLSEKASTGQHGSTKHEQLEAIEAANGLNEDDSVHAGQTPTLQSPLVEIVSFSHGDPENPYNWSTRRKVWMIFVGITLVVNSTLGSTLSSGTTVQVGRDFHVRNQLLLVLPVSMYLTGYVLGPLAFGPLSESYGRKVVMVSTFVTFSAFTLGCALAPNFPSYVVFRLLVGISASSPISVTGGLFADVYNDPVSRGRAMTAFMAATTWGPVLGPVISGFVSPAIGWRWTYWISLIIAGVTWLALLTLPETFGPIILQRRARRLRKETGNAHIHAPIELENKALKHILTVVMTRPLRMICLEAIVFCVCIYLSVVYAIFYMFFEAYPVIFVEQAYSFNWGEEGLTFVPVGIGGLIACVIYLWWDHYLSAAKDRSPPAAWTQKEEYRRLPLACLGGPLFAVSLFWVGWTARPDIPWIVPTLAGIPFGIGWLLIFIALINYLVDAYDVFAASAVGAASCARSIFGATLPFAAAPMYSALGIPWACSLLGFVSLLMCAIPFVFIRYGERIRENSAFCKQLKRQKAEMLEKEERERPEARTRNGEVDEFVETAVEMMV